VIDFALAEGAPAADEAELARLPSVRSVRLDADRYTLSVAEPHVALPALLTHLAERQRPLARLTTRHATLEDVFVSLTGRHLEEPQNGK
jgi:ABC-2 type transport system ATP-binding protein